MERIIVKDMIPYALLDTDGERLKERIIALWNDGVDKVILDFDGISVFATMFFNASLGRLVIQYGSEIVEERLGTENLSELGKETWKHSFDNALVVRNDPNYRHALETYSDDE